MTRTVERIGRMLGVFTLEQPQLTLTACAHAAELNKSTAYRLLLGLEELGLVERNDSLWRLGPSVVSLATVRLGRIDLRQEATKHLRELRSTFHAAVAFSVREGSDMIYLERIDSPDAVGVSARLGARAPMWAGASGTAVLARMGPRECQQRLDVDEWRQLPSEVRERVLSEIRSARKRGFAIDVGTFFNGIGGIATAINDAAGVPVSAISVIVPTERLNPDFVRLAGSHLSDVASQIEAIIAHSGFLDESDGTRIPASR